MPSSTFYRTATLVLGAGLLGYVGSCENSLLPRMVWYGVEEGKNQIHRLKAQEQVEEGYLKIIEEVEREQGIKFKTVPTIAYSLPSSVTQDREDNPTAIYDNKTNTIHLDGESVMLGGRENMYLNMDCYGHCFYVDQTLKHELGHAWLQQVVNENNISWSVGEESLREELVEKYGTQQEGYATIMINDPKVQRFILEDIIAEGIAEYFENGPYKPWGRELEWSRSWEEYVKNEQYPYHFGHRLVTPIIQSHGAEGIRYLVAHPPLGIHDFTGYQQQALDALDAQKKN